MEWTNLSRQLHSCSFGITSDWFANILAILAFHICKQKGHWPIGGSEWNQWRGDCQCEDCRFVQWRADDDWGKWGYLDGGSCSVTWVNSILFLQRYASTLRSSIGASTHCGFIGALCDGISSLLHSVFHTAGLWWDHLFLRIFYLILSIESSITGTVQ